MRSSAFFATIVYGASLAMSGSANAESVTLDFNKDGVKPDAEMRAVDADSKLLPVQAGPTDDAVAGGIWTLNPNDKGHHSGYLYYGGNVPKVASKAPVAPISINIRMRLLKDITPNSELSFSMRGPNGRVSLYFNFQGASGVSQIGGRHFNGSMLMQDLPKDVSLGEWHNIAVTWNPIDQVDLPAQLYVDGVNVGQTYAGRVIDGDKENTEGYVEFGDGDSGPVGKNPIVEVDWLRFGTDTQVLAPEVAKSSTTAPAGSRH